MLSSKLGSITAFAVLLSAGITDWVLKSTSSTHLLAYGAIVSPPKGAQEPCSTRSGTSAHESFCDKYYHCSGNNVTRVKDCPNGLVYINGGGRGRGNQLFGNCEYDFNVDCSGRPKRILAAVVSSVSAQKKGTEQINPCDVKGKIVGDVTYCDRYWECVNGQPELYDCPNGLAFAGRNRGVADGCDYPWRGNYCEGKQLANPPISTDHCDWLYGIFGHETSCTRYWTCWNGTATEQLCIGGLLYNEDTHACDWPENVPGCQKHPLCKEDANGNVPLGKSCNRYWQCQGGYPRLQRCPAMLVFDKKSLRCVVPPTEDCDIPSTTPPPPEEEEENQNAPPQGQQGARRQQQQQQQVRQSSQQQQQQYQNSQSQQQQRNHNNGAGGGGGRSQQASRAAPVQAAQLRERSERPEQRAERPEQRERSEQRAEGSRPVPVYVIHEASNPVSSEEDQEGLAGGNRQL